MGDNEFCFGLVLVPLDQSQGQRGFAVAVEIDIDPARTSIPVICLKEFSVVTFQVREADNPFSRINACDFALQLRWNTAVVFLRCCKRKFNTECYKEGHRENLQSVPLHAFSLTAHLNNDLLCKGTESRLVLLDADSCDCDQSS
jgi:hypothetical protein